MADVHEPDTNKFTDAADRFAIQSIQGMLRPERSILWRHAEIPMAAPGTESSCEVDGQLHICWKRCALWQSDFQSGFVTLFLYIHEVSKYRSINLIIVRVSDVRSEFVFMRLQWYLGESSGEYHVSHDTS